MSGAVATSRRPFIYGAKQQAKPRVQWSSFFIVDKQVLPETPNGHREFQLI